MFSLMNDFLFWLGSARRNLISTIYLETHRRTLFFRGNLNLEASPADPMDIVNFLALFFFFFSSLLEVAGSFP